MTYLKPSPPQEAGNQAVPEGGGEEGGRRFQFHQPERTRFPVSRLNLDHRRRKEGATDRKARPRRQPRGPTPPHRRKNPQKERRCATLLFRRRRGV
jgi:hypothetical protein